MTARTCSVDDCDRPHLARGMCRLHYERARSPRHRTCAAPGCDGPRSRPSGYCKTHDEQLLKQATERRPRPRLRVVVTDPYWWRDRAACLVHDPEAFFPIHTGRKGRLEVEAAKAVCARCPVRRECLNEALTTDLGGHGIWGGTTADERRLLRHISPAKERDTA